MKVIKAVPKILGGEVSNFPSEPIPATAVLVVFDGDALTYAVYESGDTLPPPEILDPAQ